ncbi:MAG: TIGR04255 family protein, partial [Culturomica sp.]|nr:TIGR04255 family protein [Culturomica sp.]
MNLPTQITPCPIIESNIEIRFSSPLPGDAIIGIIYSVLQPFYTNCILEPLPILQIPAEIRRQDPNLKDKPTHVIKTTDFNANIGSSVLIIGIPGEYPGWDHMKNVV